MSVGLTAAKVRIISTSVKGARDCYLEPLWYRVCRYIEEVHMRIRIPALLARALDPRLRALAGLTCEAARGSEVNDEMVAVCVIKQNPVVFRYDDLLVRREDLIESLRKSGSVDVANYWENFELAQRHTYVVFPPESQIISP